MDNKISVNDPEVKTKGGIVEQQKAMDNSENEFLRKRGVSSGSLRRNYWYRARGRSHGRGRGSYPSGSIPYKCWHDCVELTQKCSYPSKNCNNCDRCLQYCLNCSLCSRKRQLQSQEQQPKHQKTNQQQPEQQHQQNLKVSNDLVKQGVQTDNQVDPNKKIALENNKCGATQVPESKEDEQMISKQIKLFRERAELEMKFLQRQLEIKNEEIRMNENQLQLQLQKRQKNDDETQKDGASNM